MFDNYRRVIAKFRDYAKGGLCTCLHANMDAMSSDPVREDWPLGPALRRARERAGLSVREASRRTAAGKGQPAVSAGRWHQLESGWQKNKGALIPIGTTAHTVAAAARAINWCVEDALRMAGFDPSAVPPSAPDIATYSNEDLLAEIARRLEVASAVAHDRQSGSAAEITAAFASAVAPFEAEVHDADHRH